VGGQDVALTETVDLYDRKSAATQGLMGEMVAVNIKLCETLQACINLLEVGQMDIEARRLASAVNRHTSSSLKRAPANRYITFSKWRDQGFLNHEEPVQGSRQHDITLITTRNRLCNSTETWKSSPRSRWKESALGRMVKAWGVAGENGLVCGHQPEHPVNHSHRAGNPSIHVNSGESRATIGAAP
jgi:hypothetical protein